MATATAADKLLTVGAVMKFHKTKRVSNTLFSILAVVVLGVGLAACDSGGSGPQKPAHDDTGTAPHTH